MIGSVMASWKCYMEHVKRQASVQKSDQSQESRHIALTHCIVLVLSLSTVSKAAFVVIFHQSHTNKLFFHQHDSNKTFFHQVHSNKAFYQHDSNKAFLKDFINIFHPVFPMSSGECCVQLSRELSRQNQPWFYRASHRSNY